MISETIFDESISDVVLEEERARAQAHTPSGRISASMMGNPTQWNVLKLLGVSGKDYEPYLLRKFARGNQAEEWFVEQMLKTAPWPKYGKQMEVSYRGGIGFVDMPELVQENGVIRYRPHEVKSVTNIKFKRLTKGFVRKEIAATGPDEHHALQVAYYALAMGSPDAYIHYVSGDDLRVATWYIPDVTIYQTAIDSEIDAISKVKSTGELPEFVAKQKWQSDVKYAPYPQFHGRTALEIEALLKKNYPEAYRRLKNAEADA